MEPRATEGRVVGEERQQQRLVAGPHLAQEQRVHDPRRLHQLGQRLALAGRQDGHVGLQRHGGEARGHPVETDDGGRILGARIGEGGIRVGPG